MIKFKAKLKDSHLVVRVKLSFNDVINGAELEFISNTYIRGFLRAKQIKRKVIEYTGPVGIPLVNRLKKPISQYDFFFIMEQIVDATQKLQHSNLLPGKVVWDIHNVYINEATKELQLIYLPLTSAHPSPNILMFMESIIYASISMADQNSDYISQFLYFLNSLPGFNAERIEQYIAKIDRKVVNTIKRHASGSSGFMTDKPIDYYAHLDEKKRENDDDSTGLLDEDEEATGLLDEDEATGLLDDDDEATGLLNDDDGTALLDESQSYIQYPTLCRVLTGETVRINKPVFRIGKERSYVDFFVSNNNAVSRSHADIITRGQRYFVIDLNSKNRTYINDQVLPVQQEVEIFNGDRLRLANEEFTFQIN